VKVVDLSRDLVIQTLPLPGCYGGVAFAPDGRHDYVSGTPKGSSPAEGPTQGNQGDVIHIFAVNSSTAEKSVTSRTRSAVVGDRPCASIDRSEQPSDVRSG
jgi:hypothetical protein